MSFGNQYKVGKGDTIERIARKTGVPASKIRKMNPGLRETRLQIGTVIKLDAKSSKSSSSRSKSSSGGGSKYTVQSGDNNWDIAKRYGLSPAQLKEMNGGRDLSKLRPGEKITVPAPKKPAHKEQPSRSKSADATKSSMSGVRIRVTGDTVSVRANPDTDSKRVASVKQNEFGKVLKSQGEWLYVQFNNNAGWIRRDFVAKTSLGEIARIQLEAKKRMDALAKAKANPASKDENIVALSNNESKPADESAKPKHAVATRAKPSAKSGGKSSDSVISTAKSLIGTRYVWGGTSRGGFDCSGFTGYVMRQAGVSLPRTAAEQATVGTYVSRGELKKGDLIFFNTRGNRISHVGIYIGNGNFIHASSGGGHVRIDALSKAYYSSRYVTARRVGKFSEVNDVLDDVQRTVEQYGDLPIPADAPEQKVKPGADEVIK